MSKAGKGQPKVEVEVDLSAKDLANEWFKSMGGEQDEEEGEDEDQRQALRPARLGLGAKFIPHSQALNIDKETESRLSRKLKKVTRDDDEGSTKKPDDASDDEEIESRTGAIKPKPVVTPKDEIAFSAAIKSAKQKKKRKKNKAKQGDAQAKDADDEHADDASEEPAAKKAKASSTGEQNRKDPKHSATQKQPGDKAEAHKTEQGDPEGKQNHTSEASRGHGQNNDSDRQRGNSMPGKSRGPRKGADKEKKEQWNHNFSRPVGEDVGARMGSGENGEWEDRKPRRTRVKGKKTRSRQKNIRKDNRPAHLKPGYVPETAE
jgi:hypothetical protein